MRQYNRATKEGDSNETTRATGSFVLSQDVAPGGYRLSPVFAIPSSLPRSDLLLLSSYGSKPQMRPWPVSPYPAQPGTKIKAHFVSYHLPEDEGWTPWIGGTYRKWVSGTVLGYRDFAGRETMVGVSDGENGT